MSKYLWILPGIRYTLFFLEPAQMLADKKPQNTCTAISNTISSILSFAESDPAIF